MNRRCRLAVTLVTLAMHLLAPVAVYAAPASPSADYCSATARSGVRSSAGFAAPRATQTSPGTPAPRPGHTLHAHCPSCPGASITLAIPASATPFAIRPLEFVLVPIETVRADTKAELSLLPPLRGPPTILL